MRALLFVALAVSGCYAVHPAFGQAERIGMFADETGMSCSIEFMDYGLIPFYVVHTSTSGALGVRFSAPRPACLVEGAWVLDMSPYTIAAGNSQTGVTVSYGECVGEAPLHVLTIWYFSYGLGSPPCCAYPVLADPGVASGEIEVTSCSGAVAFAQSLPATVNGDPSCPCGVVANESTTWGRLKALYR